jgi:peptidoglycan hydrolase FlgJ
MAGIDAGGQFALEVNGLQRLKTTALKDPNQGVKAASQQFEALFLQQMLKSMRAAVPKSDLLDTSTTDFYTEMLDAQLAQNMAGKGLGFAERIEAQMRARGMVTGDQREYQENLIAGIPRGVPKALTSFGDLMRPPKHEGLIARLPVRPIARENEVNDRWGEKANPFRYGNDANKAPHVQAFLGQLSAPAEQASRQSGVPAKLILAQAALETGWGKAKIKTENGGDSYNLFGIKAGDYWTGKTTRIGTTEYIDGVAQKRTETFRVYDSYEESFADYARLISKNPRYEGVISAPNEIAAAHAIQRSGYATDPEYANKLVAVMNNLNDPLPTRAWADEEVEPFGSKVW